MLRHNSEKGIKAKEIAEKRFTANDILNAMKHALKAKRLFPELDGVADMITTFDVYISAQIRINGETDWYRVLGVHPPVDDGTISKQYASRSITLHPDNNKSIGADGAFNLLSEAGTFLSDKAKRVAYDERIKGKERTFSAKSKPNAFWTVCPRCRTWYEHLKVYLNRTLLCPTCKLSFLAVEIAPPLFTLKAWKSLRDRVTLSQQVSDSHNITPAFSRTSGVSNVAQVENLVKRGREEEQEAKERKRTLRRKQRRGVEDAKTSSSLSDVSKSEHRKLVREISEKLSEIRTDTDGETAVKESGNGYQKANEKGGKSLRNYESCDQNNIRESEGRMIGSQIIKSMEMMSLDVPKPGFYDFGKERTERCFGENQIWAAYEEDDGMPRYYAVIHNVISVNPFKIQLSWLNIMANGGLVFSRACGAFAIGRYEMSNSLSSFSHMVSWRKKGNDRTIVIYPMKGEVWALYRNWSPDWNELIIAEELRRKYDMVEVLEDFNEEQGVIVIPLVKVAGFKTVFQRHTDLGEIRVIPKEEMLMFSHPVPSKILDGQEAPNAPTGCRVLDPAATPLEEIEVVKEEDTVMVNKKATMKEAAAAAADDNITEANGEEMINEGGK